MVASVNTKATAADIPSEVSTFLETPKKGQMPRNCENTMLFTKMAEKNINRYAISLFAGKARSLKFNVY